MSETMVTVICNQLSNVLYILGHYECDLLALNKTHEKKLHVTNNSFTACHIEGLIMKVDLL